jgi:hypothetical protein
MGNFALDDVAREYLDSAAHLNVFNTLTIAKLRLRSPLRAAPRSNPAASGVAGHY